MNPQIKKIAKQTAQLPGVDAVYLFGSQTQGNIHPQSDIDIGVLTHNPNLSERTLYEKLPHTINNKKIDYRILRQGKSLAFLSRVIIHGEPLIINNETKRNQFESLVLRMWSDWQYKLKIQNHYRRLHLQEKNQSYDR